MLLAAQFSLLPEQTWKLLAGIIWRLETYIETRGMFVLHFSDR